MSEGSPDEIDAEELIFRRVSVKSGQYNPDSHYLQSAAFQPHKKNDLTGLSVSRGKSQQHQEFQSVEETAASGPSQDGYYVVVLRAGDIRAAGIELVAAPKDDNPGHAELPQLRADNRRSNETKERMQALADLRLRVEGPFDCEGHPITLGGQS